MAYRFEVCWDGGSRFEVAETAEGAIAKAKENWEEYGDEAPEMWTGDMWSIES